MAETRSNESPWESVIPRESLPKLRKTTVKLTRRLQVLLGELLASETEGGWEAWFLGLSASARESLSVPSYYKQADLARVLSSDRGVAASQRDAFVRRVKTALVLVQKCLRHQIRPIELQDFSEAVGGLVGLIDVPTGLEKRREIADEAVSHLATTVGGGADAARAPIDEARRRARIALREAALVPRDGEFYGLLTWIEEERATLEPRPEKIKCYRRALQHMLEYTERIDSDIIAWWALAEVEAAEDGNDEWGEARKQLLGRLGEPRIVVPGGNEEQAGRTRIPFFDDLPEYSRIDAVNELLVGLPLLSIAAKAGLAGDGDNLAAGRTGLFTEIGRLLAKAVEATTVSDQGLVAVTAVQLLFLLEFWRWHTLFELQHAPFVQCEFGGNSWDVEFWSEVVATGCEHPKTLYDHFSDDDRLEQDKGEKNSVIFLGPPGIGKTDLIRALFPKRYRRTILTPPQMGPDWHQHLEPSLINRRRLVVVDEIHLPSMHSVFGLLLRPIQDGSGMGLGTHVCWAFATSAYSTKAEFLREAGRRKDVAMRDFATRVKYWIELPALFTVPRQKYAVVLANTDAGGDRTKQWSLYLDLSLLSARDVRKEIPKELEKVCGRYFHNWVRTWVLGRPRELSQ